MGVSLKEKLLCEKLGLLCLEEFFDDGDVIEGEALRNAGLIIMP